jgi:hypothetical protein
MTLQHDHGNVYRIDVAGLLRKTDLDACQQSLAREMSRVGPVRLLFVLEGFEGWEPGANWNDLTFYVKHGSRVERIAIVGHERWRGESLMFAGADLRAGPVEFFVPDELARARAWLAAGPSAGRDPMERNVP